MKTYILLFKRWYERLTLRERIGTVLLTWAVTYALTYFIFYRAIDIEAAHITSAIKAQTNTVNTWKIQINGLQKIADSSLYQQWLTHHKHFQDLQKQYNYLLQSSSNKLQEILETILRSQSNVTLEQVKNYPETSFTAEKNSPWHLYQRRFLIVVDSNYLETIRYLQQLEKLLPNIHWDNLHYQVLQYPSAKVEVEFSIFYEKK